MTEYLLETRTHIDKIFKKLAKRNPRQMDEIAEKIDGILADTHRFKPLHFPLAGIQSAFWQLCPDVLYWWNEKDSCHRRLRASRHSIRLTVQKEGFHNLRNFIATDFNHQRVTVLLDAGTSEIPANKLGSSIHPRVHRSPRSLGRSAQRWSDKYCKQHRCTWILGASSGQTLHWNDV